MNGAVPPLHAGERAPALRISNLRKSYLTAGGSTVRAIADLSLKMADGERVAILGPSGCGKSSCLRILAGLDTQFAGTIEWGNERAVDASRLRSATVFQGDSTLPWMNVDLNIAVGMSGLRLSTADVRRRVDRYRDLVGLRDFAKAYPHELSGGMRQRAAIARALATEPLLLLMDEPLAALDAQTRLVMQKELHRIWTQTDSTVVYVTHDIEEAISLCDRLLVMSSRPGRVKAMIDSPFSRAIEPLERRRMPAFAEMQAHVWDLVAEEVGQTLVGEATR
jgi:NitT/TauT family transport system ATP-binding protein